MPARILRTSWPVALAAATREVRRCLSSTGGAVDDVAARAASRALASDLGLAQLRGMARLICARLGLDELRRRPGRWPAWKGRGRRVDPLLQASRLLSLDAAGQIPVPATDSWRLGLPRQSGCARACCRAGSDATSPPQGKLTMSLSGRLGCYGVTSGRQRERYASLAASPSNRRHVQSGYGFHPCRKGPQDPQPCALLKNVISLGDNGLARAFRSLIGQTSHSQLKTGPRQPLTSGYGMPTH
jgi:hypothetical protein